MDSSTSSDIEKREKRNAYAREWRQKNKEHFRQYMKEYHKEYQKEKCELIEYRKKQAEVMY